MRYLIPALQDFGAMLKGRRVAPIELYDLARKSLHFVGYQGLSMIAVSGLDMAAWECPGKGEWGAALRFAGRFGRASEGIQQQRVVASDAGSSGSGRDRIAR
jgi:hypothetical protein